MKWFTQVSIVLRYANDENLEGGNIWSFSIVLDM